MDCKTFQEHVTPAVDKRLTPEEMNLFSEHAGKCPECRNEFELESITQSVIRSRVKMQRTPARVIDRVSDCLRAEASVRQLTIAERLRSMLSPVYAKPAIAFGVSLLAVIVLLQSSDKSSETSPNLIQASFVPGDVIQQSLLNYGKVLSGEITPQASSDKPEVLAGFFGGKTDFPVHVPRMKECNLVGGVLNEFAGIKLAHVVYTHKTDIVYMYQACWEEVQNGKRICLPSEVILELNKTGWYSTTRPDGCSIVLWTRGRTLCSAVAHMSREALISCLTDGSDSGNPLQASPR